MGVRKQSVLRKRNRAALQIRPPSIAFRIDAPDTPSPSIDTIEGLYISLFLEGGTADRRCGWSGVAGGVGFLV